MEILTNSTFIWIINILFSAYIVFYGRKNPRSTLTWLLIINLLPIVGFLFFILIGRNQRKNKMFSLKKNDDKRIENISKFQYDLVKDDEYNYRDKFSYEYRDLIKMNLISDYSLYTEDNDVKIFYWGKDKFDSLLEDIKNAQHSIDIQYYILRQDKIGLKIISLLEEKLKEGVKVRILYDAVGSRKFRKKKMKRFLELGGEFTDFFPFFLNIINFRINHRNHRKMVIIDDAIGYIGGFNVGDDYLGEYKTMGRWRDTHLRIVGGGVIGLKLRFLKDWYYASGTEPNLEKDFNPRYIEMGDKSIQIVTSGPDTEFENIKNAYISMINSAKKYIYIQTPYFVPDQSMIDSLRMAIIKGVEVNLMIPSKPDHIFIYWATTSFVKEFVEIGAKAYSFNNGFLHSKVLIVDDYLSSVGSANIDERSFSLNFEANAIIYSHDINEQLRNQFMNDVKESTQLTLDYLYNRPMYIKIREPISRLFAPLL